MSASFEEQERLWRKVFETETERKFRELQEVKQALYQAVMDAGIERFLHRILDFMFSIIGRLL